MHMVLVAGNPLFVTYEQHHKGAYQPVHSRSLISGFIISFLNSKTCVKRPPKIRKKTKILMTNGSLMDVESIAECSPWSTQQYLLPVLSDNWY